MTPHEFWDWFRGYEPRITWPPKQEHLLATAERLQAINRGLAFEIMGPQPPKLCVSAAGDRALFALVHQIVRAAPRLARMEVVAFRQRAPIMDYVHYRYVLHVPRAILAAGLAVLAAVSMTAGVILDTIAKYHRETIDFWKQQIEKRP